MPNHTVGLKLSTLSAGSVWWYEYGRRVAVGCRNLFLSFYVVNDRRTLI